MLRNHFISFGPIDHFTLHLKLRYSYGFIQYKTVYSAAAALRNKHHLVGGYRVKVSVADSWHQPNSTEDNNTQNDSSIDSDSSETMESRTVQMLDLNDDCLIDVFSYLNFNDLVSVNQTCIRFQPLSEHVFRKKHTAINLTDTPIDDYSNVDESSFTLLQIRNLFVSFGPQIQKLKVASNSFKQENRYRVLDLLIRSCTSLRVLCLTGFYIKESLYKINTTFFSHLEDLSLTLCEVCDSIKRVFSQCHELRKLTIQSDSNLTGSCIAISFPRLESMKLVMNSDIETRHLNTFIKLNLQLTSLKIIHCRNCIFDDIFPKIATFLPNLEVLNIEIEFFHDFNHNIMHLLQLNHLRELQLNCSRYSVSAFVEALAAKQQIEVLHLSDGLLNDNLIDAITKCKKLTSLKLCSMPNVHNRFLSELARNLPLLNDFHVSKCQLLTSSGVIQFVGFAERLQTLNIANSSVEIDDKFFLSLEQIYKTRGRRLTLNLNKVHNKISSHLQMGEHKRFIQITRPNPFDQFFYDIFSDESSDLDEDDDDDDEGNYYRLQKKIEKTYL